MKRQSADTESLVYAYGCGEPTRGLQEAESEQERCKQLWDTLVGIERDYEQEIIAAAASDVPQIAVLSDALTDAKLRLRSAEDAGRRKDALGALRETERALWPLLSAWRKTNIDKLREIEQRRRARVVAARQATKAWWCNYNAVIQRYETARIETRKRGRRLREHDTDRDRGCLTVQIQRTRSGLGAAPHELQDGTCNLLSIGRVPDAAYDPQAAFRCERDRMTQTVVEMRIDAAGNHIRLPIWMHRLVPDDARIKQAQIVWSGDGYCRRWGLRLTISRQRKAPPEHRSQTSAVVRIVIGNHGKDLRVATVETLLGGAVIASDACDLDAHWLAMMDRAAMLQARIDDEATDAHSRTRARMERPGLLRRLLLRRREQYRLFARAVAQAHRHIRIETPALSEIAYVERGSAANAMRHRAAAHVLIAELQHQAHKHGATVELVVAETAASAPLPRRVRRRRISGLPVASSTGKAALATANASI